MKARVYYLRDTIGKCNMVPASHIYRVFLIFDVNSNYLLMQAGSLTESTTAHNGAGGSGEWDAGEAAAQLLLLRIRALLHLKQGDNL